jgi:hypothetical protein
MLENYENAYISATLISGSVKIYLGLESEKSAAFKTLNGNGVIELSGNQLLTELNYYVTVESL